MTICCRLCCAATSTCNTVLFSPAVLQDGGLFCAWDDWKWPPRFPGCGSQHPLRALGGTCVLLAAAPTTPPCFRRWRRSSSLLLRGGWSPEVGRGESEHPSLPLAQRSVFACLRQAGTFPSERDDSFLQHKKPRRPLRSPGLFGDFGTVCSQSLVIKEECAGFYHRIGLSRSPVSAMPCFSA